jgi:hypothetical protein
MKELFYPSILFPLRSQSSKAKIGLREVSLNIVRACKQLKIHAQRYARFELEHARNEDDNNLNTEGRLAKEEK